MKEVKQYWLDYIFSCKNSINKEQAKVQIEWLYKFCGLEEAFTKTGKEVWTGEHADIPLKKGIYKYVPQVEFDPYQDIIRQVRD